MLSAQYFEKVLNEGEAEAWLCRFPTMVLFSGDTHLAALSFKARDGQLATTVLMQRQDKAQHGFIGIVNREGTDLEFVLTNLTDLGFLNMNLMVSSDSVKTLDPGPGRGLNQINEIHEKQSIAVTTDQATNRTMRLVAKVSAATGKVKSLGEVEDEAKKAAVPEEELTFRFFVSVAAQVDKPELVTLFRAGTTWRVTDKIILLSSRGRPQLQARGSSYYRRRGAVHSDSDNDEDCEEEEASDSLFAGGEESRQVISMDERGSRGERGERGERSGPAPEAGVARSHVAVVRASNVQSVVGRAKGLARKREEEKAEEEGVLNDDTEGQARRSKIAKVVAGDYIDVRSGVTGKEYDYEHTSELAAVFITLDETMDVRPRASWRDMVKARTEHLKADCAAFLAKKYVSFLAEKAGKFESDDCVVCLDTKPDVRFYGCGHLVCHKACADPLSLCPMCRQSIAGRLAAAAKTKL